MPLAPGTKLGQYEVVESVGVGGMGEVYRARDTKLGRDVAIKVLPEEFSRDKERLERFEREARLLAQLNHANIATLHGLEEHNGQQCLIMELVAGETLAERISRGPIPLDEAVPLFIQIADGLEAAHEKGIVHRDLKPPNIKITPDGKPKILDFGLAKARADVAGAVQSESPTVSAAGTRTGIILGTPAYMSPEQARGKPLDKRTDIWAFGCVLFEALTGRAPFLGETLSDTLASILERDPDWSALPPTTSAKLEKLLRRCLQKPTTRRLRDIGDARMELEDAFDEDRSDDRSKETTGATRRPLLPWGVAAVLAVVVGVQWTRNPVESPKHVVRTAIPLPSQQQLTDPGGQPLAIARDGRRLAYTPREAGMTRLYLRSLDEAEVSLVPDTDGARYPFFSPDGEWVGYWAAGRLYRALATGGPPLAIGDAPGLRFGVAWGPDGTIIFANSSGLQRIPTTGGDAEPVGADETVETRWPQFLPDGGLLAVRDGSIVRLDSSSLEIQILWEPVEPIKQARYLPSGHLVYGSAGDIIAVAFDLETLEVLGVPVPVAQDLYEGSGQSGAVYFASSNEGTMVFVKGGVQHNLVLVDRNGQSQPLAPERVAFRNPTFAPDGQRVAVAIDDDPRNTQIWIYDFRGSRERFTSEYHNHTIAWTPDSTAIAFASARRGRPGSAPYLNILERQRGPPVAHRRPGDSVLPDSQELVSRRKTPRSHRGPSRHRV